MKNFDNVIWNNTVHEMMPVPSATKALEAIRKALEEADVLGYYQTDLDIIADALQDK